MLTGWGGGLSEPIKIGKFVTKIFFSDNVEWNSKYFWKKISADVKANKNNNKVPSKLEIQCKKGMYFSFDFA